jgi:hypothetical protein
MSRRLIAAITAATVTASLAGAAIAVAGHDSAVCTAHASAHVSCTDGDGLHTPGGGGKVSHAGWPVISGVLRQGDNANNTIWGGPGNDELLGLSGSDHIIGGAGNDVLWGDKLIAGNDTHQRDILSGGPGDDWIYPSHGTNIVNAGPGNDHVVAYYGHGSIDCGPGKDIVQVRENGAYTLRNCEHVVHFCQFGSFANGNCKKPGERAAVIRRRP